MEIATPQGTSGNEYFLKWFKATSSGSVVKRATLLGCGRNGNGSVPKTEIDGSSPSAPSNNVFMTREDISKIEDLPGVYYIKNIINGKYYIG